MAKYISRTITEQKYNVKYYDVVNGTVEEQEVTLVKKPRTNVGLEKALEAAVGGKVVAQYLVDEYEKRYGVEEQEFLRIAKELPLLPSKDEEA